MGQCIPIKALINLSTSAFPMTVKAVRGVFVIRTCPLLDYSTAFETYLYMVLTEQICLIYGLTTDSGVLIIPNQTSDTLYIPSPKEP